MTVTGWHSYERRVVPHLGAPFASAVRDAVPAGLVVDLAAGTGALSGSMQARGDIRAIAVDPDPDALAVARALRPGLTLLRADALALPLRTASADAVVCQQGLQFVPDLARAAAQIARVLAAGAPLVALTWDEWGSVSVFCALAALAEVELGRTDVFRDPCALPPARLAEALRDAGLRDVEQQQLARTMPRHDDADLLAYWTQHTSTVLATPWRRADDSERRRWLRRFSTELSARDRELRVVLTVAWAS
ncbi:MAG: methyltransferase domain-containing protein [Pseudonocardiaceae bacterium]|nr:methyltransferase domain-containing protein [Pseudonocardiaceae bacterium]